MMNLRSYRSLGVAGVQLNVTTDAANKLSSILLHYKNKGDNITVIHKCFLPTLSVIAFSDLKVLTKRSVGRNVFAGRREKQSRAGTWQETFARCFTSFNMTNYANKLSSELLHS